MKKLTEELFSEYVGETFTVALEDRDDLKLELVEVALIGNPAEDQAMTHGRGQHSDLRLQPFSLVFRGPHEPPLPQRMYKTSHPVMGVIEQLFLVPIGADDTGRYYEAVFN